MGDRISQWLRVALAAAVVVLAGLFLTACGSGGGDSVDVAEEAADTAAEPDESDGEAEADADAAESDEAADAEAPAEDDEEEDDSAAGEGGDTFEEFFGFGDFDDPEAMVEMQRETERLVQVCMAGQGFEYNQNDVSADQMFFGGGQGEDQTAIEYAQESGYGLFTSFDQVFEFDPEEAPQDPNGDMLSAMSDGERDAWQLALYGQQPDIDPATGMPIDPETGEPTDDFSLFMQGGGCANEAQEQIFGSFQVFMELEDEFEELEARVEADPRMIELTEGWTECIGEQGFSYTSMREPFEDVLESFQDFQSRAFNFGPGMFDAEEEPLELDEGEDPEEAFGFGPPELTPELEAELAEEQAREIEIAVADATCSDGMDEALAEITAGYEAEFIDENRAVLESARPGG